MKLYSPARETIFSNRCGKFARNIDDDDNDDNDDKDSLDTDVGKTLMVHQGWAITWAKSDTTTLTPQLPTLTSDMRVPKWTPGEKIRDGEYDAHPSERISSEEFFGHDLYWFLVVGVPVLAVLSFASCVWCCVRRCRKKRKNKQTRTNVVDVGSL